MHLITGQSKRVTERLVLVVAVMGTAMVYLDQTAVNVAIPTIQAEFDADLSDLQWIIDIYILTLATLLLLGGVLGDRYGRVRINVAGMAIFIAASVACGVAPSLEVLIAARGVQGIGGALLVPAGLAMINATVASERRGRVIGNWATLASLVIAFGPSLGGWLVDQLSWRMVFFINVPIGAVATALALTRVPESRDERASGSLDWPGAFSLIVGLGGLLFATIEGPARGWIDPLTITALAAGLVGLIGFVLIEAHSEAPMIPLGLFRNREFAGINFVTLIQWMALSSIFFFLTLNLQQIQGYTPAQAGLAVLPISLSIAFLSRAAGHLSDKIGPLPVLAGGLAVIAAGLFGFSRTGLENNYWTSFFPVTLVYGLGVGTIIVPVTTVAMGSLESRYSGIASGTNNAVSRVSQMLAIAFFGAVMAGVFKADLQNRTAQLPLNAELRAQLLASAENLGNTQPPPGMPVVVEAQVRTALQWSFIESFRAIIDLSAVLTLISLGIVLAMIGFGRRGKAQD